MTEIRGLWFPGVSAQPSVSSPSRLCGCMPKEWKTSGPPDKVAEFMRDRWLLSWPNKGYGNWGVGNYCPAGSCGANRYINTDNAPFFSSMDPSKVYLGDVNGDGLADMFQVRANQVDVWLNKIDSFEERAIIDAPWGHFFSDRLRIADMNGTHYYYQGKGSVEEVGELDIGDEAFAGMEYMTENWYYSAANVKHYISKSFTSYAIRDLFTGSDVADDAYPPLHAAFHRRVRFDEYQK